MKQKKWKLISRIALFLVLLAVIVQLLPNNSKFKYNYSIGKPWDYETVMAPFDFPIHKTEKQLNEDKESIMANYSPYFRIDNSMISEQFNHWIEDWNRNNSDKPKYEDYIYSKLNKIYNKGLLSVSDLEQLNKSKYNSILIVKNDRTVEKVNISDIYTPLTAYKEIINNKPFNIDINELKGYNINLYLVENLRYDSITSEMDKKEKIKNLSKTIGLIQNGEKIVGKGEIVTANTVTVLHSLQIELDKRSGAFSESGYVLIGKIIMIFGLLVLMGFYLYLFRPNLYENFSHLLFISLLMIMIIGFVSLLQKLGNITVYVIPFAILPIIIRVFFDTRTALFTHFITILITAFMVDNPFLFMILQLCAGMTAVSGLKDMSARSQLTQTAGWIFLSYAISYVSFELIVGGNINNIDYMQILFLAISSVLLLFAHVLIYIFEKIFKLISSVTLVELTNINSDFMLEFAEIAPGSFQHSLQVSNLAAEAAKKINANSLLIRTGGLYHDIGKMLHPEYFIENQMDGVNPLNKLGYKEASQAIINHVIDGVELAKKKHLPNQIIHFIATHHGRSQTKFFYNLHVNEFGEENTNIEDFTYPGPLPDTKETAILMMADAVEARSRTLEEYSEESIYNMVHDMIDQQIADGQFKNSPISFKDVETVKNVMVEKVRNIYHGRIKYPEIKKDDQK